MHAALGNLSFQTLPNLISGKHNMDGGVPDILKCFKLTFPCNITYSRACGCIKQSSLSRGLTQSQA